MTRNRWNGVELYCESSTLEASASFGYGFKLGAIIMPEMLDGRFMGENRYHY
jgi:hypothetical protein